MSDWLPNNTEFDEHCTANCGIDVSTRSLQNYIAHNGNAFRRRQNVWSRTLVVTFNTTWNIIYCIHTPSAIETKLLPNYLVPIWYFSSPPHFSLIHTHTKTRTVCINLNHPIARTCNSFRYVCWFTAFFPISSSLSLLCLYVSVSLQIDSRR